jgi:O-antigen/teichoic acid export membrane protein
MAAQGWQMLTAFLVYAYLSRKLGTSLFGAWAVVLSLLAWFEIFVTAGLVKVATKAISETPDDSARLERAAYVGQGLVALAIFVAVQVAADAVAAALGDASLAPLIRISALDIPLYGAYTAASSIVLGRQRFRRQGGAWLVYATSKAVLVAVPVAMGFGVPGALVGNAVSSLVGLVAMWVGLTRAPERLAGVWPTVRSMLMAGTPFLILSLLEGVVQHADLWIVSAAGPGAHATGLYAAATVLAGVPVFLFLGLNRVIFPSVAAARAAGEFGEANEYVVQSLRAAIVVTVLAVAIAASVGRQGIEIVYSAAYAGAFVPLVLLMLAAMGRTIQATCTEILMAETRSRSALTILVVTVVAEVVAVSLLTVRWGLVGAGAGAAVSGLLAAVWAAAALRDSIGARPIGTLLRACVAGAVVAVPIALLAPAPLWLLAVLPLAVAAYAGMLVLLREFSSEELATMRSSVWK